MTLRAFVTLFAALVMGTFLMYSIGATASMNAVALYSNAFYFEIVAVGVMAGLATALHVNTVSIVILIAIPVSALIVGFFGFETSKLPSIVDITPFIPVFSWYALSFIATCYFLCVLYKQE